MQRIGSVSYLILAVLSVGALAVTAFLSGYETGWTLATIGIAAAFIVFWLAVRRGESPPTPDKRVRRALGAGRPVVLHFYSDLDVRSLIKRMLSAGAEREYRGRIDFIYVSMLDAAGQELARRYIAGIGTFVLFDARGREVGRPPSLSEAILADLLERAERT